MVRGHATANHIHRRKADKSGAKRQPQVPGGCKHHLQLAIIRVLLISTAAGAVVWLRWRVAGGHVPHFPPEVNPAASHPNWAVRYRTFFYLAARHALLLWQTAGFTCHYSHESVPLLTSAHDTRQLLALGVLGPLLAFAGASTMRFSRALLAVAAPSRQVAREQRSGDAATYHLCTAWFGSVSIRACVREVCAVCACACVLACGWVPRV